jgi:hypothetical protein
MEIFSPVFNYITDNSRKLSHKAITVFIFLAAVILIDNIFSITYYYSLNKKIDTIKNLNSLVADSSTTVQEKAKFLKLKGDIINHLTIKEKLLDISSSINNSDQKTNSYRDMFLLHYISANLLLIIFWITINVIIVRSVIKHVTLSFDTATKISVALATIIVAIIAILFNIFCYFLALVVFKISALIPIVFGNIYFNFIAYTLFNIALLLLFAYDFKERKFNISSKATTTPLVETHE